MKIGMRAFARTTRIDRTHLCPFSLGRIKGIEEFETFFLDAAAGASEFCDTVGHPRVSALINWFHANMEVRNMEDVVCLDQGMLISPRSRRCPETWDSTAIS